MPVSVAGRTAFSGLIGPEVWEVYEEVGKERPPEYPAVFNMKDLPWNPATSRQVSGLGTVPSKPEGTAFVLDAPVMGNTITVEATPFGLAAEFTYELWEDEQYGVMRDTAAELARSGRNREEVTAWAVANNAFSTSFPGFKSGEALCSTSHASFVPGGPTQANRPSPDVGFSITGIQGSILRYHALLNERGLPQIMHPTNFLIHANNLFTAREILGSTMKPFTANNEVNSLVPEDFVYMVSHYLTSVSAWWLLAKKGEHDLNFAWRTMPILDSFDDPWTKNAVFTIYFRLVAWWAQWRGVDGSTG